MNKIAVANWKMYLNTSEASHYALKLKKTENTFRQDVDIVLCPSFLSLQEVGSILSGSKISLGAQDIFWEERGAYTGEVSPADLVSSGCRYVLLGHSERRKYFHETNAMVHEKVRICLRHKIIPIICIGENWDDRRQGQKDYVLIRQLNEILGGIDVNVADALIIAYEPVWAISAGGGINATPDEVQYAHQVIRHVLLDLYDHTRVNTCFRIIYGGSVDLENVNSYAALAHVSGVLVGNASTKFDVFTQLIQRM